MIKLMEKVNKNQLTKPSGTEATKGPTLGKFPPTTGVCHGQKSLRKILMLLNF